MHIAEFSVKQPVLIASVILALLLTGAFFYPRFPVDLLPNNQFPMVRVLVSYPGAGPKECEEQLTKPLEEGLSGIQGVRHIHSVSKEGYSAILVEFALESDLQSAKDLVKEKVSGLRGSLPLEVGDPVIQAFNPTEQPILLIALHLNMEGVDAFEFADRRIKPLLEQVPAVAQVEIIGSRKREIVVELDRKNLTTRQISAGEVCRALQKDGRNVPAGKYQEGSRQTLFRTLAEFTDLEDIRHTLVRLSGNEIPITVGELATVREQPVEEKTRAYLNGKSVLLMSIQRQNGANTVAVAEAVTKMVAQLNGDLGSLKEKPRLQVVRDKSSLIRNNVADVKESIFIGILLTIGVVWFFLGSMKATLVTALALPISLLGAFIPMYLMGFSINIVTLLALSLTVGLLIDDAIVVRENIFRQVELGKTPREASIFGTKQVTLAVIATTLTVLSVFGPIAFTQGLIGQFLKEFGLTVCFAMSISLFDSLTIAPMLSTYFIGKAQHPEGGKRASLFSKISAFSTWVQDKTEAIYLKLLKKVIQVPMGSLAAVTGFFVLSLVVTYYFVPRTFLAASDSGQFPVLFEMPAGTSLEGTDELARKVDQFLRGQKEVAQTVTTIGTSEGEVHKFVVYVDLVPKKERKLTTSLYMEKLRKDLAVYAFAKPCVREESPIGSSDRSPFNLLLFGDHMEELSRVGTQIADRLKNNPALRDLTLSLETGAPEYQVVFDRAKAREAGVASETLGLELRTQIEGVVCAHFRKDGYDSDIRVRALEDQRDLRKYFSQIFVPNVNGMAIPISKVSKITENVGPSTLYREDRKRVLTVNAELAPQGGGLGAARSFTEKLLNGKIPGENFSLPKGVRYQFSGMVTQYNDLVVNMALAMVLGIVFMYLVLSSLYKSFLTPISIIAVLPLAATGGLLALAFFQKPLDAFTMIGGILLLGVATKNSILLIDRTLEGIAEGLSPQEAVLNAGAVRLRPILMTSIALIAGMVPVAVGLNEASSQRTGMGILLIGGLLSSTVLSLFIIPAVFLLMGKWTGQIKRFFKKKVNP